MKILVLNSGSSSLKYQVIDMENEKTIPSSDIKVLEAKIEKNLYDIHMQNDMVKIAELKKKKLAT